MFFIVTGYTLAAEGDSCGETCVAKGLTCVLVMTANLTNVLERLGELCPSFLPYDKEDPSQPYVASNGACHGVSDVKFSTCDASKAGVRRLCRCEKPGELKLLWYLVTSIIAENFGTHLLKFTLYPLSPFCNVGFISNKPGEAQ